MTLTVCHAISLLNFEVEKEKGIEITGGSDDIMTAEHKRFEDIGRKNIKSPPLLQGYLIS